MSDEMMHTPPEQPDQPQPPVNPPEIPANPQPVNPPQPPVNMPQTPANPQPVNMPQTPVNLPQQQPINMQKPPLIPPVPPAGFVPPAPDRPRFSADVARMLALPPISKEEAEKCRHRREKPWYHCLIVVNIIMIVSVILMVFSNLSTYREKVNEAAAQAGILMVDDEEQREEAEQYFKDAAEDIPVELQALAYGIAIFVALFFVIYYQLAQVRASALKITPRNFPEIYALVESYAHRLGMERVPDVYVAQQSGVLNAFSAFIIRRQYLMINSEVFETAYREHHDMNSLAFIIAHEISHVYYGHATLHYNLAILFANYVPIVSQTASRTREYSCDRLAQRLTDTFGLDAMFLLIMDRHLYKHVDKIDYLDNALTERGFFLWLVNLLSTHPIMTKRIRALTVREGSGELY